MQAATRSTIALLASSFLIHYRTVPLSCLWRFIQPSVWYGCVDRSGWHLTVALDNQRVIQPRLGIIADKFDKTLTLISEFWFYIAGFIAIPLTHNIALVVVFFSLINCAYSVFYMLLKAYFADTLPPARKPKSFP